MSSAQDPFYIVKEEIQGSIDKLQSTFHQSEYITADGGDKSDLRKELLTSCESIEWQVDELDKTIAIAARDPCFYGVNDVELEKRRRRTSSARTQVGNVKKAVLAGTELNDKNTSGVSGMRRELMRMPNSNQMDKSNQYSAQENDDFITSESDRQLLLIKWGGKMKSWMSSVHASKGLVVLGLQYMKNCFLRGKSLMIWVQRWIVHQIVLILFRCLFSLNLSGAFETVSHIIFQTLKNLKPTL